MMQTPQGLIVYDHEGRVMGVIKSCKWYYGGAPTCEFVCNDWDVVERIKDAFKGE